MTFPLRSGRFRWTVNQVPDTNEMKTENQPMWTRPDFEEKLASLLTQRRKTVLPREGMVVAAVLLALFKTDEGFEILLTKRSHLVEHHRGEISFPGGKLDDTDPDLLYCALRETSEEVGVDPADVRILGELDDFYTVATHFLVVPFVGIIPYPYEFTANSREIDEVIGVPLEVFLDPDRRTEELWTLNGEPLPVLSYRWRGYNIWGATARILDHFAQLIDP